MNLLHLVPPPSFARWSQRIGSSSPRARAMPCGPKPTANRWTSCSCMWTRRTRRRTPSQHYTHQRTAATGWYLQASPFCPHVNGRAPKTGGHLVLVIELMHTFPFILMMRHIHPRYSLLRIFLAFRTCSSVPGATPSDRKSWPHTSKASSRKCTSLHKISEEVRIMGCSHKNYTSRVNAAFTTAFRRRLDIILKNCP